MMVLEVLQSLRAWRKAMPLALFCACAAAPVAAQQPHVGGGPGGATADHKFGPDPHSGAGSSSSTSTTSGASTLPALPGTPGTATGLTPLGTTGTHAMPSYLGAPFGSPSQRYTMVPSRSDVDSSADAAARRNGRMSDSERRELRRNIEDAGRDVYRPKP